MRQLRAVRLGEAKREWMTDVVSIGTYLPPWSSGDRRVKGPDEDALTMAVAAGRAADPGASAQRVVMVSRNFPLLEGGNGAVLLAGLSLGADIQVTEVLGGAPAVLDQAAHAEPGTLVIAADDSDAAVGRLRCSRVIRRDRRLRSPGRPAACPCWRAATTEPAMHTSILGCNGRSVYVPRWRGSA